MARVEARTRIRSGATPSSTRRARRRASASVLPVPAAPMQQQRPVAVLDRALLGLGESEHGPTLASARPSIGWPRWTFSPQTGWESAAAPWRRSGRSSTRCAESRRAPSTRGSARAAITRLVIDRRCEDAVFAELEELAAQGASFVAVSEERGEVELRRRRPGSGRDRPDRRLAQRPPHPALPQPQHRRRLRRLDGRRRVRLRLRLRRRRGVRRPAAARARSSDDEPIEVGRRRRQARAARARGGRARSGRCRRSRRSPAASTACAWSARSRSPPPTSPPAASTRCSACAPAARSTPPPPS